MIRRVWSRLALSLTLAIALFSASGQAQLPERVRFLEQGSPLQGVFFRPVELPNGAKLARRPPRETRAALGELIAEKPEDAALYALRAHEAERQLDFAAAEVDWQRFAELAASSSEGLSALATFYGRRLRSTEQIQTLLNLALLKTSEKESHLIAPQQSSWKTFQRMTEIIQARALPAELGVTAYRAWIERYPGQASLYRWFFDFLMESEHFSDAETLIGEYQQAFPRDMVFPLIAKAAVIRKRDSAERAVAFYHESFQPLWPSEVMADYLSAFEGIQPLRTLLEKSQTAWERDPEDLRAAAKVFYYYQYVGNLASAKKVLVTFRQKKEAQRTCWGPEELRALAGLFAIVNDHRQAARYHYALYQAPQATEEQTKEGLTGLIDVLIFEADRLAEAGALKPSLEGDVASLLRDQDFWEDVRPLLLPCSDTESPVEEEKRVSREEPQRVRFRDLLAELDTRFPQSERRAGLYVKLLQVYEAQGDSATVLKLGREFLASSEDPSWRTQVLLLMGSAHSRANQWKQESALYDSALQELAVKADRVPLGNAVASDPAWPFLDMASGARSPDYALILNRYLSRLSERNDKARAMALYEREIERNPGDPGLYASFAAFLREKGLGPEFEQLCRQAIQRFSEASWYYRLGPWYLAQKNYIALESLTGRAFEQLPPAEAEAYFDEVVKPANLTPILLRLGLLAHERFPFNLTYVRHLLRAYSSEGTRNEASREALLRQYWFYDDDLRGQFLEFLSRSGKLDSELEVLKSSFAAARSGRSQQLVRMNAAAAHFLAEAEVMQSRLEQAVALFLALANEYPVDLPLVRRAAAVFSTIALANPLYVHMLMGIEENLRFFDPGNRRQLARMGEVWAERQQFERAKSYWEQIAAVEPGNPEAYREAARAFEAAGFYREAARFLERHSDRLQAKSAWYSCEVGRLHEQDGNSPAAVARYLEGALRGEGSSACRDRLLALAKLPRQRDEVELATRQLTAGENPGASAVELRVAVLEAQGKREGVESFLVGLINDTTSVGLLTRVRTLASERNMEAARQQALARQIELTDDPPERLRLQLWGLHSLANRGRTGEAEPLLQEAYHEHPQVLSAVQSEVDSHWKSHNFEGALGVLNQAARDAYPQLGKQPTLLAARQAAAIGGTTRARLLLETLLTEEPLSPVYVTAMADAYEREGRQEALREFLAQKTDELDQATRRPEQELSQSAGLRRRLIEQMTASNNQAEAVRRYAEMMSRHPTDQELIREATGYATRHGRGAQLIEEYQRATALSEDDELHATVLASLRTLLGAGAALVPGQVETAALPSRAPAPPSPVVSPTSSPSEESSIDRVARAKSFAPPTVMDRRIPDEERPFCVQVGAFNTRSNATRLLARLLEEGYPARKVSAEDYDRVLVGAFKSWSATYAMEKRLAAAGYETWVRRRPSFDLMSSLLPRPAVGP